MCLNLQSHTNKCAANSSHLCMKKLLLLSAILVGAATASQAGISFNIGIHLPVPVPPGIVISHPAPVCEPAPVVTAAAWEPPAPVCETPAPVVVTQPAICAPVPVVVAPPVCEPSVVIHSRPVIIERPVRVESHFRREGYYASGHERFDGSRYNYRHDDRRSFYR